MDWPQWHLRMYNFSQLTFFFFFLELLYFLNLSFSYPGESYYVYQVSLHPCRAEKHSDSYFDHCLEIGCERYFSCNQTSMTWFKIHRTQELLRYFLTSLPVCHLPVEKQGSYERSLRGDRQFITYKSDF